MEPLFFKMAALTLFPLLQWTQCSHERVAQPVGIQQYPKYLQWSKKIKRDIYIC